jgi:hypothetical protein
MAHVYAARRLVPQWLARGEGYFIATAVSRPRRTIGVSTPMPPA